ncbi:H/ACA ribonucleoprotein complex, subunit Gar1/Naf1 [Kalmanozyma brasiliensis GHG001]|uniref:H/ACA ribonucleoprotein complex, subunit Gar1/Naf1 n=1 Tax=Kalmanozyma brasiliensis (strain GHG001) TaxID=1365824 RepID=UPI0028682006|nr:H/ACA ribonucleoprotein complex, subunit Gar1/Naf1 [Kalmanozyma brasiliensis GHG001]EST04988.2 H/ACA ribonucleoprotein complex, subunit Gar1/Naf1 [Kalmanozyma brasiliensis GHG001]
MAEDSGPSLEPQAVSSVSSQHDSIPSPAPPVTGADAEVPTNPSLSTSTEIPTTTVESTVPIDAALITEAAAEASTDASVPPSGPSFENVETPAAATTKATEESTTVEEDDTDFVPPDMEHIVSTGAAQDAASSMQALRELVAQARASSGQQREALPPGFGDDEIAEDPSAPQEQRGEKRKAEDELEKLVQSSTGIDEVKAAAEQSQHPETKTLLQKALSSISGLVSRRPKADSAVNSPTATSSEQVSAVADAKPLADGDDAGDADDSDDESSSDSGSSSSDSSDDDDDDDDNVKAAVALAADDDDDEEGGGPSGSTAPVTKNEILAPQVDQPATQELSEAEKLTLRKLGKVHSIVDSVVVVEQDVHQNKQADGASASGASVPIDSTGRQGERQGEYSVLDTGSLLCFEDGKVLGLVFETFGSIHNPMYSIRFASAAAIDRELVKPGETVFYLPSQSTYVLTQLLRQMKGSDASNMWDEEVAEDEIDYSDDEQEAEAKRRAKAIRSGHVDDQGNPLSAPSARGNKRQKQHGADQPPNNAPRHPANGSLGQRPGHVGPGSNGAAARPNGHGPASLPRRSIGGPNLPLPPAPARSVPSGAGSPQGIASLPPRPSAGLPSKPAFASDASMSAHRPSYELGNGAAVTEQHSGSASRSRMGSTDSSVSGFGHSRMTSAAASSLPAKPVDAAAAATAASSASSPPRTNAAVSPYGAQSPPQAYRPPSMRKGPSANPGAPNHHQGSPAWHAGLPNMSAPPAGQPHYGAARTPAYGSAAGGPVAVQGGGHYNPAYAGHWQPSYGPAATSARPTHAWNGQQSYQAAPIHMTPGSMSHQSYGGYGGGHAGYGAPPNASGGQGNAGNTWSAQAYPGSHYPGYTDQQQYYGAPSNASNTAGHSNQGYYATSAQAYAYGNGGYASPAAYGAAPSNSAAAPSTPQQDSYDPTSPSFNSISGHGQNQHGASNS